MINIKLSEKIAPIYYEAHKKIKNNEISELIIKGGRGSLKSSFASIEIMLGLQRDPKAHAVCFMKFGNLLQDSVYNQIKWAINELGLSNEWVCYKSPLKIENKYTHQLILFRGLDEKEKAKGIKFLFGYCKYMWFEEANLFDGMEDIRFCQASLQRKNSDVEQDAITQLSIFTYNPPKEKANWINKEARRKQEKRMILHTTYLDAPKEWLTTDFIEKAEKLKEIDEKAYQHEYLGQEVGISGLVYPMFTKDKIITELEEGEVITDVVAGADGGAMIDATTVVPIASTTHGRLVVLPTFYYDPTYPGHQPLASIDQAYLIEAYLDELCLEYIIAPEMIEIIIDSAASDIYLELQRDSKYQCRKVGKKDTLIDMRRLQSVLSYNELFYILNRGYTNPTTNELVKDDTGIIMPDMLITELENKIYDSRGRAEDGADHSIDACKYATWELQKRGVI